MRVGGDVLAALALALGAHAALGLLVLSPDGRAGADSAHTEATAALAAAGASALVSAWSRPPVAETATVAPPTPDVAGEPAPPRLAPAPPAALPRPVATTPSEPGAPTALPARDTPPDRRLELADSVASPPDPPLPPGQSHRPPDPLAAAPARRAPADPPALPRSDVAPRINAPPERVAISRAHENTLRPRPRPERQGTSMRTARAQEATTEPASAPSRAAKPPGGSGGQGVDPAEAGRLKAAWAGAIGARIARAQRHPGGGEGSGRVRITLVVARDGRLAEVRVAASSGSPGLDRAAIAAVRRAAPFPEAPGALPDDWMRFGQWIAFR